MMSEYIIINEKVTTWIRRTIQVSNVNSTEEAINKVIQFCKENKYSEDITVFDSEELPECEEAVSLEDNNGDPTIDIVFNGDIVWDNGNHNCL